MKKKREMMEEGYLYLFWFIGCDHKMAQTCFYF